MPLRAPFAFFEFFDHIFERSWYARGCASPASWQLEPTFSPLQGIARDLRVPHGGLGSALLRGRISTYRRFRLFSATSPLIYLLTVNKVCCCFSAGNHEIHVYDPSEASIMRGTLLPALYSQGEGGTLAPLMLNSRYNRPSKTSEVHLFAH